MATKSTKSSLKWVSDHYSDSYVSFPHVEERGRVVVRYTYDNGVKKVTACVWGPDAGSEATESITFVPKAGSITDDTLPQKARTWVEERIAFLDSQQSFQA